MRSQEEKWLNKRDLWSNPGRHRPVSNISLVFLCNIGGGSGRPNSIMEGYCHPCWSQSGIKHHLSTVQSTITNNWVFLGLFPFSNPSIRAFSHISSPCFFAPEPHMLIWWRTRARNVWRKNISCDYFVSKNLHLLLSKPVTVKLIQLQLFYLCTQRCTIIYVFNKLINSVYFWCSSLKRWRWSILHRGHMRRLSWWRQDPCGPRHGFHHDLYPN